MIQHVNARLCKTESASVKGGQSSAGGTSFLMRPGALIGVATATCLLSGCINITAPQEPIVIELNVNIRAEVLYRLVEDANETIDRNADIF